MFDRFKHWQVAVTQDPRTIPWFDPDTARRWTRAAKWWPVVDSRLCWTRTGAHLYAARYAMRKDQATRIADLRVIS